MYNIGIDLGGTNIAVGIVDADNKIIIKGSTPTEPSRPNEEVVKDMAGLCKRLIADAGLTFDDIKSVGIASPGALNPETGIVAAADNLHFRSFPIVDLFKKYIPLKHIFLENDANAAALGETIAGAAKGMRHAIMITLGTGVGGGIIINGKIYSGFNYAGGELGHMVIEYNGVPCTCGRSGCMESYSSATGLIRMTKEKIAECEKLGIHTIMSDTKEKISGKTAFSAMRAGDAAGKEVVDKYISYLACGITNLINIFRPEVVVIGGGICNEKNYLTHPLKELVYKEVFGHGIPPRTIIKTAELGNDAGIIGAAALGR